MSDATGPRDTRGPGDTTGPRDTKPGSARNCFVCGPDNPVGLHLVFRLEGDACVSDFTPGEHHVGYPGVVHGGMIYSALDDVMANWLYLRGARAYTASCRIRYRTPASVGEPLRLVGRQVECRRKLAKMEGTAVRASDGTVVATATATFVIVDETEFRDVQARPVAPVDPHPTRGAGVPPPTHGSSATCSCPA